MRGDLLGKRIDFILEALRDPWVACHDVVFLVAGAGPLRSEIERVEGRNLRFLGALDRPDVSALLQESDVFCGLSKSEGFGYSMLEAAICGAFLIVTDVGIASDLCPDDSFGCVVDRPSAAKLIEVLQKCSDDRSWMKRLAGKCSTRAEGLFSWDNAADAVVRACLR